MYDSIIIGSGPAGLSATINLKLHNKNILWIGSLDLSYKVAKSEKIANYPGFGLISGEALNNNFKSHMAEMEITPIDKKVTLISQNGDTFMVLADSDMFESKTIILASGTAPSKGFINELDFLGRGVSYCATCDGFLNKGKDIAIYCASKRYEHEVLYLAELANKIFLFTPYKDCNITLPNIEFLPSPIKSVNGERKVEYVELVNGDKINVNTLFCLRESVSTALLCPQLELDGIHAKVNRLLETNLAGFFAAGDITGRPYQLAKAIGEGNVAAHSVIEYLSKNSHE